MRRVLGLVLLAASLTFLGVALAKTYHRLPHGTLHLTPASAVVAVIIVSVGNSVSSVVWWYMVRARNIGLPFSEALRITSLSQLGKYLPGGFWQPLGWVGLARDAGVGLAEGSLTIAMTLLLTVAAALVVGPVLLVASRAAGAFVWLLLVVPAALAALHPRVLSRLLSLAARITRRPALQMQPVSFGTVAVGLALALPVWLIHGSALVVTAAGLGFHVSWTLLVGAFAVAWAVGFLAIPVPGGLGVREAVLLLLLRVSLTSAQAIALAVVFRLAFIVAEGAMTLVAMAIPRRRVAAPAAR